MLYNVHRPALFAWIAPKERTSIDDHSSLRESLPLCCSIQADASRRPRANGIGRVRGLSNFSGPSRATMNLLKTRLHRHVSEMPDNEAGRLVIRSIGVRLRRRPAAVETGVELSWVSDPSSRLLLSQESLRFGGRTHHMEHLCISPPKSMFPIPTPPNRRSSACSIALALLVQPQGGERDPRPNRRETNSAETPDEHRNPVCLYCPRE
jgi:hypothetical protein